MFSGPESLLECHPFAPKYAAAQLNAVVFSKSDYRQIVATEYTPPDPNPSAGDPPANSPTPPAPVAAAETAEPDRRDFMKQAASVAIGGVIGIAPACAGIAVYLDPLRKGAAGDADFVKLTNMDALPDSGEPRKFSVYADKKDAWTTFASSPVGAVYIAKLGDDKLRVLNVVCPHAGCFVDYINGDDRFFCPCHDSSFNSDGSIKDAHSPSPRPLDELEYEIRENGEVWVKFMNFLSGREEKVQV